MPYVLFDRVMEVSTTTGTGPFTLAGAVPGFRTFASVLSVSDTVHYYIELVGATGIPTGEWETGLGTYSGANTLTRTTVIASSNGGAAVNFSAGTKRVAISHITASVLATQNNLSDLASASTARTNLGLVAGGAGDIWVEKAGDTMTGSLGIGVAPSYILDILAAANSRARISSSDGLAGWYFSSAGPGARSWSISAYNNAFSPSGGFGIADESGAAVRFTIDTSGNVDINSGEFRLGGVAVIDTNRLFRLRQYTVATLPTVGTAGRLAAVTDANAPTYNATVAGGGAVKIPVYDDGTNWTSH